MVAGQVHSAVLIAPGRQWRPSMHRTLKSLDSQLTASGLNTQTATPPGTGWLGRFAALPFTARAHRADIYHVVDHSLAHASAFLPPRRTVISVHDLYLLREAAAGLPVPARHLAQFRFSTSFIRRAGAIVAQTEATKADIVELLGIDPSRIDVVRLGVDDIFQPASAPERERLRASMGFHGPTIVQIGSSPYKNLPAVVETLAKVRQSGIDATVVHIADPIPDNVMARAAALGVSASIRQLGRVSDEQLVAVLNAGDVLLFPSLWEGMGWPPLEAMACGLPVVASNIAPVAEVAGTAALLADPADTDRLAHHVGRLLTDPGLAAAQRAAGYRQVAGFNWKQCADDYLAIYERLSRARGHTRG